MENGRVRVGGERNNTESVVRGLCDRHRPARLRGSHRLGRALFGVVGPWHCGCMSSIQRVRPQGLVSSPASSHVVVIPPGATTIHVGGQNSVDEHGSLVGGDDVAAQSSRALANAKTALESVGQPSMMSCNGRCCSLRASTSRPRTERLRPTSRRMSRPVVTAMRVAGLGLPGALGRDRRDRRRHSMTASP